MTGMQVKQRKTELKRQHLQARGIDRIDRIEKSILLRIRQRYEDEITGTLDPALSQKLDCITFLLES